MARREKKDVLIGPPGWVGFPLAAPNAAGSTMMIRVDTIVGVYVTTQRPNECILHVAGISSGAVAVALTRQHVMQQIDRARRGDLP